MTDEPRTETGAAASEAAPIPAKRSLLRRVLVAAVGVAALGLVASVVPLRDRCAPPVTTSESPRAGAPNAADASSTAKKVATDRADDGSCILHALSGDVHLAAAECSTLRCEPGLVPVVAHANVALLLALALVTIFGTIFSTLRWFALLRLAGFAGSFASVWRVCLASQAGALLLPAGVGGDALRFGFLFGAKKTNDQSDAKANEAIPGATLAATVFLDRMLGLVSLTTLGGLLAAVFGGAATGKLVYILFAIPPLFFVGFAFARTDFVFRWPVWRKGFGAKLEPVLLYIRRPGAFTAVGLGLLASMCLSGSQLGVVRGIVFALGGHASEDSWMFLGGAMGLLVAGLPGLPGGWGTADAAYVFFLARGGLGASIALAVCLLNRIFYYGVAAVGAGVLLAGSLATDRNPRGSGPKRDSA